MRTEADVIDGLQASFTEAYNRDDIELCRSQTAKDVAGRDSFKREEPIIETEQRFEMRVTSPEVHGFRGLGGLIAARAA